jgi:peroxiredoxin Q/BCP
MTHEYELVKSDGSEVQVLRSDILSLGDSGIILYFYPKDNTPWCTIEANDFSRLKDDFDALWYSIVWVSKDNIQSHQRFRENQCIQFPLISDTSLVLHNQFSTLGEKTMFGKKYTWTIRSTFVLDTTGSILHERRNVKTKNHADIVYQTLLS